MTLGCVLKWLWIQLVPVFPGPTPMKSGPLFSASSGIIKFCDAAVGLMCLRNVRLYPCRTPEGRYRTLLPAVRAYSVKRVLGVIAAVFSSQHVRGH